MSYLMIDVRPEGDTEERREERRKRNEESQRQQWHREHRRDTLRRAFRWLWKIAVKVFWIAVTGVVTWIANRWLSEHME